MSLASERVKRWRENTKIRIVKSMGGSCVCCGYNKCNDAMDLHHIDPSEKEFGLGKIMAQPRKWSFIIEEIRKCVLLCSNCHREFHAGVTPLPENYARFDERYEDRNFERVVPKSICPCCGEEKMPTATYCSRSCSAKTGGNGRIVVDWSKWNVLTELESKSMMELADEIGCSHAAVWKKVRKLRKEKGTS